MRRWVAALVVCLLTVGAGCAGGLGDAADATPAGSPGDGTDDGTPPGVDAGGVVDVPALVAAHTAELSSTSFTVRVTQTRRPAKGDYSVTSNETWRVESVEDARLLRTVSFAVSGDPPRRLRGLPDRTDYLAGDRTYRRVRGENRTRYSRVETVNTSVRPGDALYRGPVAALSERKSATVEQVTHDGEPHFRVRARLNDTRFAADRSLRLLVAPDGVVRELRYTRTRTLRSPNQTVTDRVRFTRIGATSVARPPWYEAAAETGADGG